MQLFAAAAGRGAAAATPGRSGSDLQVTIATVASGLVGAVTFFGSLIAFGKLQGIVTEKPVRYPGEQIVKILLLPRRSSWACSSCSTRRRSAYYWMLVAIASVLGIFLVIPIGGADMPIVVALLELVLGYRGRGDRLRALEQHPHHRRFARGRLRDHPHADHVQGDEPLARERPLRWRGRGRRGYEPGRRHLRRHGEEHERRRGRDDPQDRAARRPRARLRNGGRARADGGASALPSSSRRTGSPSSSASIPWRAACRGT